MSTLRVLMTGFTVAMLAGLSVITLTPPTLADVPSSEGYRLVASEVGYLPAAMQSAAYGLNAGVAIQAEVAPPMGSEHYSVNPTMSLYIYLPLVLKAP